MDKARAFVVFIAGGLVGLLAGRVPASRPPSEPPRISSPLTAPPAAPAAESVQPPPAGARELDVPDSAARPGSEVDLQFLERVCSRARSDDAVLLAVLHWIPDAPDPVVAWMASRLRELKSPAVEAAAADLIRSGNPMGFLLLPEGDLRPATCEILVQAAARGLDDPLAASALQRLPAPDLERGLFLWDGDLRLDATRERISKEPSAPRRDQILLQALGDPSPSVREMALDLVGKFGIEGPERDVVTRWLWDRFNDAGQPLDGRCKAGLVLQALAHRP